MEIRKKRKDVHANNLKAVLSLGLWETSISSTCLTIRFKHNKVHISEMRKKIISILNPLRTIVWDAAQCLPVLGEPSGARDGRPPVYGSLREPCTQ